MTCSPSSPLEEISKARVRWMRRFMALKQGDRRGQEPTRKGIHS
jgi:hypothetical protein